ncbi:hypothetical protein DIPPA_05916 [Diplonema papillatum]|nr:hypothetical protein DIPPA_05916 [Diplonema papillatum]
MDNHVENYNGDRRESGVRIVAPSKVEVSKPTGPNRAAKTRAERQTQQMENEIHAFEDQYNWVLQRVKTVPRRSDSEQRLWEAVDKLSDLTQLQKAQLQLFARSAGRFQHKNDSREAKLVEENLIDLKRREAKELQTRKADFERMMESHSAQLSTVRMQLLEEQSAHEKTAELLQDQEMQTKHAAGAYKEVQGWLDEAQQKVKKLGAEVKDLELRRQSLADDSNDMTMKISNLSQDVGTRERLIKEAEVKAARIQKELSSFKESLQVEKDTNKRLNNQIAINQNEANAEAARAKHEIAQIEAEVENLVERTQRWEKFDELCPDYKEIVSQMENKDEVLHRAKQVVATKHSDEQTLIGKARQSEADIHQLVNELKTIEDTLDNIVTVPDTTTVGKVCVAKTLVCCYPDPCPVGRDVNLIITTVDNTGLPIRGVHKEEFKVQQLTYPPTGGCIVGDDRFVDDVQDNERASSTFCCSYTTGQEGRAGFKVQFRGHTFLTTASVPAPSPMHVALESEATRRPRFTVHCSPNTVASGEVMNVAIVVRQQGSLLPARFCNVPVDQFRVTPYSTAQGIVINTPLKQVAGTAIFKLSVPIDEVHAQGTPRDYAGVEVMIQGGTDAARGSVRLVSDSRNDVEWDPTCTTISCYPDPVSIGDEVSVAVTARNSYWIPLPNPNAPMAGIQEEDEDRMHYSPQLAPTPVLRANGSSTLIEQPAEAKGPSQVYVGKFIPSEFGRCGVAVDMGGIRIGTCSVTVKLPEKVAPENTILSLEPAVVPAGDTIQVSVTTCDSTGRLTPGPEPTALRLTPLSASTVVLPLRRVSGTECKYVTTIRTSAEGAYTTAGLSLNFEGATFVKKVRVGGARLDVPVDERPAAKPAVSVPKYSVAFNQDPVAPGSTIPLTIAVNQDHPSYDRRNQKPKQPVVKPLVNCELAGDVAAVAGARYVWRCLLKVGETLGTSSVTVELDNHSYSASTTVDGDTTEDFKTQVSRLHALEIKIRDLVRNTEERERDVEDRSRELDKREADIRAKEEEQQAALAGNSGHVEDDAPANLLFGMMLSDGIQYGSQWDAIDGAKVVEIMEGGPLDSANPDHKIAPGDILKEAQWEDTYGYVHTCSVRQMDDFKRICRMLSRTGMSPKVTLTFLNAEDRLVKVHIHPGQTPEPPGRSMGTRRHPSKSIDTSICGSSPSPARSRG